MKRMVYPVNVIILLIIWSMNMIPVYSQETEAQKQIDEKVKKFLESHKNSWYDMNISTIDGQILYDLIIQNNYTRALEIGTSTGHSGIWIAWALSKTGGKLITIDIDEDRYREAMANFKEAGVSDFIDARLADAHTLVPVLPGPFDFVFCDADKDWLTNYIKAVLPGMTTGGCFTAHNVSDLIRTGGIAEFREYVVNEPRLNTSFAPNTRAGISISYKIK